MRNPSNGRVIPESSPDEDLPKRFSRPSFGCRIHLRATEPFQKIIERASFCERQGYDIVFVDDHLLYGTAEAAAPEATSTVTAIGLGTKKVRVALLVTDMVRRHPAILAQTSMTLSSILPGRFILGLGTGDPMNLKPFGIMSGRRFGRFREGVTVMKKLWASSIASPTTFNGAYHRLAHAYIQPSANNRSKPASPPPLYFAASGEKMLRITGEEADGWIPQCHSPESYGRDLKIIRSAALGAERDAGQIAAAYYTVASIAEASEDANKRVLATARYFLALNPEALRRVDPLAPNPGRVWEDLDDPRIQREKIRAIASEIPQQTALNTVIHGSSEDCIEQVIEYQKAGCEEFMLTFIPESGIWAGDDMIEIVKLFTKKVLNYFREEYD